MHDIMIVGLVVSAVGAFIILIGFMVWYSLRTQQKRCDQNHQERMAAIEKGIEPPPPLVEDWLGNLKPSKQGGMAGYESPHQILRKGLLWLFVGLGIMGMYTVIAFKGNEAGSRFLLLGLIPVGIGLAQVLYYVVAGRRVAELYEADLRTRLAEKK